MYKLDKNSGIPFAFFLFFSKKIGMVKVPLLTLFHMIKKKFLFCMIGVFKDPKVLSSTYLQEGKSRDSTCY